MDTIRCTIVFWVCILLCYLLCGCGAKQAKTPLFVALEKDRTGLHFVNKLTPTPRFNMFHYMYFYNGAGIGAGDFNKDGFIDLFFSSNQSANKLFLNSGSLKFKDVTAEAKIPQDGGWSTGVSVVDINRDGLLDIYICKVGNYETLHSKNQFLICKGIGKNGIPFYEDQAAAWGVHFSGFSTHAAFFDYDGDGDLDLFLVNHSVHQNGSFAERKKFLGTYHPLSGDRLYRNDGARFTDVTRESGIHSSAISYGLGIAVSDINLDGYPDLYVGNDFHENDYLYINQKNGTFKDVSADALMHTSQFTMGVDVADITNDGYPEIISMDMLPSDPYILKRSLGDDEFDISNLKVSYGYNHQYTRNNLQWSRRNGQFSEVGLLAGVAATDWSWAPLWMDFDNDGWKDLFISNGIPKRLNDIDYINYVSNSEIQEKIRNNNLAESDMALIEKFPQIKLPNGFFKNKDSLQFQEVGSYVENSKPTYSNGAVYADLDNDGDLDIVVNNIDDPVLVYENKTAKKGDSTYLDLKLNGPANNRNAVGARVVVFSGKRIQTYEKYGVRGFQSSMEIPLHIGLGGVAVDSMFLIWPDNSYQRLPQQRGRIEITYRIGLPEYDYTTITSKWPNTTRRITDITLRTGLQYRHEENPFVEFHREPLLPFMVSKEGPGLAVGNVNGDGRDDVFIGSSKGKKSVVFFQTPLGTFEKTVQPDLENDSTYEDVDACWTDVNSDGFNDLVVASGGNEYYGRNEHMQPRVYVNDGHGVLKKLAGAFSGIYLTASCIVPGDFNKDGKPDLFVGARAVPWEYGQIPASYLLQNDGAGHFTDVTATYGAELLKSGFVTGAVWADLENDGDPDLVLALEWDGICAFRNENGHFKKKYLTNKKGLWNFTLPCDVDGDGDLDLIAGNLGLNSRLQASEKEPLRLYYTDFDNNGKKEQVLTYYLNGKETLFANKEELQKQLPFIKKRFLYAEDFAKATLEDVLTTKKLKGAVVSTVDYLPNAVLINNGKLDFTVRSLPRQAQLTPYKDAVVVDANRDTLPDILLGGNFYETAIQMGRYDADYGTLLINKGGGNFVCESLNGLAVKGQVRRINPIRIAGRPAYIFARNNDSTLIATFDNK
jgi:hypothetical protein